MATLITTSQPAPATGLRGAIVRHPLIACFLLTPAAMSVVAVFGPAHLSRKPAMDLPLSGQAVQVRTFHLPSEADMPFTLYHTV